MKRSWTVIALLVLLFAALAFFLYQRKNSNPESSRASLLAAMPTDAAVVLYANVAALRQSPFISQLLAWAPQPQLDPDYARFQSDTGFDYRRDLDQLSAATIKTPAGTEILAIADGKFDRKKIESLAAPFPAQTRSSLEVFLTPATAHDRTISFAFLRDDRIALTNGRNLAALLDATPDREDTMAWRQRFDRLAGSPLFAVIRQDAHAGSALASQAPGGFESPQLSALLDQLQWITVAGKPQNDHLRIVAEGESPSDTAARQLSDFLQGIFLLAQAGLSGPQNRRQLDPKTREAYIELFRGAEVSRVDRGETKSVRLVFDITPKFLDSVRTAPPANKPSAPSPNTPPVNTPDSSK